jgi:hypothetical protein
VSRSNSRQAWRSTLHSGAWYTGNTNISTQAFDQGAIWAIPFFVPQSNLNIQTIGFEITTAVTGDATATMELALYNDTGNCYPGTKSTTVGSVSTTTIGFKTFTVSYGFVNQIKWLAWLSKGVTPATGTSVSLRSGGAWNHPMIGATVLNSNSHNAYRDFLTLTYTSLPVTWPAIGGNMATGSAGAKIWLQVS